jgi:hypothetical protein
LRKLFDAGRALDDVLQALEMLYVEGGDDVDPGVEHLLHVLVAAAILRAGRVGVRDLVDQNHARRARDHRLDVELLDDQAAILDAAKGHRLEAFEESRGLGAAVGLDEPDHHVHAPLLERVRFLQHAIGLADAGREADVHLEPSSPPALDELEKVFGAASCLGHRLWSARLAAL